MFIPVYDTKEVYLSLELKGFLLRYSLANKNIYQYDIDIYH